MNVASADLQNITEYLPDKLKFKILDPPHENNSWRYP
jgi:hypothetical protein